MTNSSQTIIYSEDDPELSAVCQILEMCNLPSFCVTAAGQIVCANSASGDSTELVRKRFLGQPASAIDPRLNDWSTFFSRLESEAAVTLEPEFDRTDPGASSYAVQARFWRPLAAPLAVVSLRDVSDEWEQQAGLLRRDAILQAMSSAASRYLADDNWDDSCNALLRDLGEATGVSRVYIFEAHFNEDNLLLFSQRYEWVAPAIAPQIDNVELQNIPMEAAGYGRWLTLLSRGRLVAGQVQDFPESERKLLESQSILSLAVVPIFTGSKWWGMMGFDECSAPRVWSVAETEALRTVAGLLGLATERREVARQAREKQDSIAHEARLVTMGEMASGFAHEINQPLSAVSNYCETGLAALEAGSADTEILQRAFRSAAAQAQRAGEIIRRLREFVSKRHSPQTMVDLNELIGETLALVAHDARGRGIRIVNGATAKLPPVLACRVQIQQVLVNLIRNGIEAIEEAGDDPRRTLSVCAEQLNSHLLRISVLDTGRGLDPQLAGLVFEPFETNKPDGMGLGLSISRTIVEAHGGSLSVDGDYKDGACFQVDLPSIGSDGND